MGRLKWKPSREIDLQFAVKLKKETDVERNRIIVEYEIMHVLINNPDGIGILELAKIVGIDRSNIGPYLNKLIKTGYVKRGAGLQGKYFPTDKSFENPLLSSHIMGEIFASEFLGKPNLIIRNLPVNPDDVDFRAFLPYLQREEFGLLRVMFEFANCTGAYMTYILIQAMNPENKYLQHSKYLNRDTIIQYWVKISIDAVIRNLLGKFKDSIGMELDSIVGNTKDPFGPVFDYQMSIPQFQLKKEVIDEMLLAFSRLYPLMFTELEKLRNSMPLYMHVYKDHKEYLKYQATIQKSCKHDFDTDVHQLMDNGRKFWTTHSKKVIHCKNCHLTTYEKYRNQ